MFNDTFKFEEMIREAAKEVGVKTKVGGRSLAAYMYERAAHLATIAGQKGFEKALRAERNNVALAAGLAVDDAAAAGDRFLVGVIQGALRVAAGVLAG